MDPLYVMLKVDWVAWNKRRPYSAAKGDPRNSIPWARHSPGSCGGIALAFVTSRKKASIWTAGINAIRILPRVSPTYAQTRGTWRGASSESPGFSRILSYLDDVLAFNCVEPLVLVVMQVARRATQRRPSAARRPWRVRCRHLLSIAWSRILNTPVSRKLGLNQKPSLVIHERQLIPSILHALKQPQRTRYHFGQLTVCVSGGWVGFGVLGT